MEFPKKPKYEDYGIKKEELHLFNKLNSKVRRVEGLSVTILWLLLPIFISLWINIETFSSITTLGVITSAGGFLALTFLFSVVQLLLPFLLNLYDTAGEKIGRIYAATKFNKKEKKLFKNYSSKLSNYNAKYFDFQRELLIFQERYPDAIPYGDNIEEYAIQRRQKEKELELRRAKQERIKEAQRKEQEFWLNLTGYEFEVEIRNLYQRLGFKAICTPKSGDGGVDIKVYDTQENLTIIQCKNHQKKIGPVTVRELFGVMHSLKAQKAILICSGGFNKSVINFAKENNIGLLDLNDIINMQKSLPSKREDNSFIELGINYQQQFLQ